MEDNTYWSADKERLLSYKEIEKILRETLIDNGVSAEAQPGTVRSDVRDKSVNMEGRLASLEQKLSNNKDRREPKEQKNDNTKAMVKGKEVCYKYNSRGKHSYQSSNLLNMDLLTNQLTLSMGYVVINRGHKFELSFYSQ